MRLQILLCSLYGYCLPLFAEREVAVIFNGARHWADNPGEIVRFECYLANPQSTPQTVQLSGIESSGAPENQKFGSAGALATEQFVLGENEMYTWSRVLFGPNPSARMPAILKIKVTENTGYLQANCTIRHSGSSASGNRENALYVPVASGRPF